MESLPTILIVEDDPKWIKRIMMCDFLHNIKTISSESILTVQNYEEAGNLIKTNNIDLAITDFFLENDDITQFPWRNLAQNLIKDDIPIIVVSGFIKNADLITEMVNEYGVVGIYHKGQLDLCKLGKKIESIVNRVKYTKKTNTNTVVPDEKQCINFLHLSDLHFGNSHRFSPSKDLPIEDSHSLSSLIIEDIKEMKIPIDVIAISGDITDKSDMDEFEAAIKFIEELQKGLNIPEQDIVIIPGNHDITWREDTDNPVSKASYRSFYKNLYGVYPEDNDRFFHIRFIQDKNLIIVGLDSCVIEKPDCAGIGFVGPNQRKQIKKKIKEIEKIHPDCLKIAILHHHLMPVEPELFIPQKNRNFSLLMDASMVLRDLYELNFAAILHGHKHEPFYADLRLHDNKIKRQKPIAIISSGSAGSIRNNVGDISKNHYQIIEIDTSKDIANFKIKGRVFSNEKFENYGKPIIF